MHKKSFTFGLGTGLIIIAVLLYGAYAIQLRVNRNNFSDELNELEFFRNAQNNAAIRDIFEPYQIFQWATEHGMVFAHEVVNTGEQSSDYEHYYESHEYYEH